MNHPQGPTTWPPGRSLLRRRGKLTALALATMAALTGAAPSLGAAEPSSVSRSRTGATGQTLTVSPADGLNGDGDTVRVQGKGFDPAIGTYLGLCIDNGPAVAPGPCVGGAATGGGTGSSYWISSNPPSYAVGLTIPYESGGAFDLQLKVSDGSDSIDCLDPETPCVVATRADHLSPGVRSADVKVPVSFAGQAPIEDPPDVTLPVESSTTSTASIPSSTSSTTTTSDTNSTTTSAPGPSTTAPTTTTLSGAPSDGQPGPSSGNGSSDLATTAKVAGEVAERSSPTQDVGSGSGYSGSKLARTGASSTSLSILSVILVGAGAAALRVGTRARNKLAFAHTTKNDPRLSTTDCEKEQQ